MRRKEAEAEGRRVVPSKKNCIGKDTSLTWAFLSFFLFFFFFFFLLFFCCCFFFFPLFLFLLLGFCVSQSSSGVRSASRPCGNTAHWGPVSKVMTQTRVGSSADSAYFSATLGSSVFPRIGILDLVSNPILFPVRASSLFRTSVYHWKKSLICALLFRVDLESGYCSIKVLLYISRYAVGYCYLFNNLMH